MEKKNQTIGPSDALGMDFYKSVFIISLILNELPYNVCVYVTVARDYLLLISGLNLGNM
jgi:hypothetical protein